MSRKLKKKIRNHSRTVPPKAEGKDEPSHEPELNLTPFRSKEETDDGKKSNKTFHVDSPEKAIEALCMVLDAQQWEDALVILKNITFRVFEVDQVRYSVLLDPIDEDETTIIEYLSTSLNETSSAPDIDAISDLIYHILNAVKHQESDDQTERFQTLLSIIDDQAIGNNVLRRLGLEPNTKCAAQASAEADAKEDGDIPPLPTTTSPGTVDLSLNVDNISEDVSRIPGSSSQTAVLLFAASNTPCERNQLFEEIFSDEELAYECFLAEKREFVIGYDDDKQALMYCPDGLSRPYLVKLLNMENEYPELARLNTSKQEKGDTFVHALAKANQVDSLRIVCEANVDALNAKNDSGYTAMHYAVMNQSHEVLAYILEVAPHLAYVLSGEGDESRVYPIHHAFYNNALSTIPLLLSMNSSNHMLFLKDSVGLSAMDIVLAIPAFNYLLLPILDILAECEPTLTADVVETIPGIVTFPTEAPNVCMYPPQSPNHQSSHQTGHTF